MWGLRDHASYFFTPADIAAGKAHDGEAMRLGGMVERGSIQHLPDGVTIRFVLTDGKAQTPVIIAESFPICSAKAQAPSPKDGSSRALRRRHDPRQT